MVLLMINTKSQTNPLWSSRVTDHAPSRWEVKTGPCNVLGFAARIFCSGSQQPSCLGSLVCSDNHKAQGTAASSSWKNARNLRRLRKWNGKVISSIAREESICMRRGRLPASLLWNSTTLTTEHLHLCHSLISNRILDSFSESIDSILMGPKGRYCRQTGLDLVILSLSSAAALVKNG